MGVKKWRARSFSLNLPYRKRFVISIRRFKTSPGRDSRKYKQFILEIHDSPIKELAFVIKRRSATRKKRRSGLQFAFPARPALATLLIVAGVASAIFFASHLHKQVSFDLKPSQKVQAIATPAISKSMAASVPVELNIPHIGLDTRLQQTGVDSTGSVAMPWDIEEADWYKYSPTPGQIGPSVIVGHLDGANYANMTGVFYKLNQLIPGDQIIVTRVDGTVATFKVLYLKQVSQTNFPTQEVYGNINYAGIRLITCGGTFDSTTGHYNDNTVVFGALE